MLVMFSILRCFINGNKNLCFINRMRAGIFGGIFGCRGLCYWLGRRCECGVDCLRNIGCSLGLICNPDKLHNFMGSYHYFLYYFYPYFNFKVGQLSWINILRKWQYTNDRYWVQEYTSCREHGRMIIFHSFGLVGYMMNILKTFFDLFYIFYLNFVL